MVVVGLKDHQLVISKNRFWQRMYPLDERLRIDFREKVIAYQGKVVFRMDRGKNMLSVYFSYILAPWPSYFLAKKYLFEWKADREFLVTENERRQFLAWEEIAPQQVRTYGDKIAEKLRKTLEERAREILGPEVEIRVAPMVDDTHYIAFYHVYQRGVRMCADEEEGIRIEDRFPGHIEINVGVREIVIPRHIYPAKGIYKLSCLPEAALEIADMEAELLQMKEKGMAPAAKYQYLLEEAGQIPGYHEIQRALEG